MALIKESRRNTIRKALKRHLSSLRLPFLKTTTSKYESVPVTNPHQTEVDENALNEALEARLMELIASSPQQDQPIKIKVKVVPANLDLFSFGGNFVAARQHSLDLVQISTQCQRAQAQEA